MAAAGLVLVVEDDLDIREVMSAVVVEAGHAVACFDSVADALRFLENNRPRCMVIDLQLGDGTAEQILDAARGPAGMPPTIIVSASLVAAEIAKRYGVAFLPKPFDLESFVTTIEAAMAHEPRSSE